MKQPSSNAKLDALLEHGGWVRALAQSLVADCATAEDLEQKTWLAAVEHPPKHSKNPKAWLGSVVRNLAGMHWRESSARRRRESVVAERRGAHEARNSGAQQPDGLTERVETFQILATALGSLAEPYGTTLYLRFFEELTMREIAKRMSVPESTTQARITRGLEMLRKQLESTLGNDWRAQCLVFTVPLAAVPTAAATAALVMTLKAKILLAATAVLLVPTLYFQPWVETESPTSDPTKVVSQPISASQETPASPSFENEEIFREQVAVPATALVANADVARFQVKVVEVGTEKPLEGIGLNVWMEDGSSTSGRTGAAGVWGLPMPIGKYRVGTNLSLYEEGYDYQSIEEIEFVTGELIERIIKVPQRFQFTLLFKTPSGAPLRNQEVHFSNSNREMDFRSRFTKNTDAAGAITAPFLGTDFRVTLDTAPNGMCPIGAWLDLEEENDGVEETLTLFRGHNLHITVLDEDHQAVEGAQLRFGFDSQKMEHGSIAPRSDSLTTDHSGEVVVVAADRGEIRIDITHPQFVPNTTVLSPTQSEVVITLDRGKRLRGTVVDENGQPIVGAEVKAGVNPPPAVEDSSSLAEGDMRLFELIRSRSASPPRLSNWKSAITDETGGFSIESLYDQGPCYLVVKADGFAHHGQEWGRLPDATQDIVLHPSAKLFGFLVDADGEGVHQGLVQLSGIPVFGETTPWQTLSYYADTYRQRTAEDGSFSFPGLASGEYQLQLYREETTLVTVHTGPDPIYLSAEPDPSLVGKLDEGMFQVDFHVTDSETGEPVANADITLMHITEHGAGGRGGGGRTDASGHSLTRPTTHADDFFMIRADGYIAAGVFESPFPDGLSKQEVRLNKAVPRNLQLLAEDGLPLIPEDTTIALGVAVLVENGFMIGPFFPGVFPLPELGVGPFGKAGMKEGVIAYKRFPADGATIRIEGAPGTKHQGEDLPGPTIDIYISAGTDDVTVTLTMAQLRALGLRE